MLRTRDHQLRTDLKALGDRLASADPSGGDARGATTPAPRILSHEVGRTRRRRILAIGIAGAAAAIALVVALSVVDRPGRPRAPEGSVSLTDAEVVACSDGIGYGRITEVEDVTTPEEVRLSLAMDEWLKPPAGAGKSITFETASAAASGDPRFRIDERVLLVLQDAVSNHVVFRELEDPADPVSAQAMGKEIARIIDRDEPVPCPSFWGRSERGAAN